MNVGFAGIDIGFARMDVVAVLRRIWSFWHMLLWLYRGVHKP
jgi:hypothetical protein